MMFTRIKICGITRVEDALCAADLGATALGFIFWSRSPRFIDPYRARRIVRALPPLVTTVGVFVDQPLEYVRGVAGLLKLGAVQLHGRETPEFGASVGARIIKAIPVETRTGVAAAVDRHPDVTILLDAHDPVRAGGTGRTVDWQVAAETARRRRVILSGGIRPENVREALQTVRPYGIDVSSGVEGTPGVKDPERLRALFEAVRGERSGVQSANEVGSS